MYDNYQINVYVESQQATILRVTNVQQTWRKIFTVKFKILASNIIQHILINIWSILIFLSAKPTNENEMIYQVKN